MLKERRRRVVVNIFGNSINNYCGIWLQILFPFAWDDSVSSMVGNSKCFSGGANVVSKEIVEGFV